MIHQLRHSCAQRGNLDPLGKADVLTWAGQQCRYWCLPQRDTRGGAETFE